VFQWRRNGRRIGKYCGRLCYFQHKGAASRRRQTAAPPPAPRCACGAALESARHQFCDACRKARARASFQRTWTSVAVHVARRCRWCERLFTTRTAAQLFCRRRCGHRWSRVSRRHGLTEETPAEIVRAYRLLGEAIYLASNGRPLTVGAV
jgi:hypothetical protein